MSAWIALFILALGAMFLLADTAGTIAGVDSTTFGYVVLCVAIIVYLTGGMLSRYGGRATFILRDAVTWLALGLGLVTIYTYRETLLPMAGRVAGELIPGSAMTVEESSNGATEVRLRKRMDGHFVASVAVNGKSVSMIVDTGASEIVLRPEDAEQVGRVRRLLNGSGNGRTFLRFGTHRVPLVALSTSGCNSCNAATNALPNAAQYS